MKTFFHCMRSLFFCVLIGALGTPRGASAQSSPPETWWHFDSAGDSVQVAISGDGNYIAACSDKLYLFHKAGSTPLWNDAVTGSVAISNDGSSIAVGSPVDHHVYCYSKESNDPLWQFDTGNEVTDVDISGDGTYIVAGTRVTESGEPTVYLFHKDTNTPLWSRAEGIEVKAVDISTDGGTVAAAITGSPFDPGRVYLFSNERDEPLWFGDMDNPTSVALSGNGSHLAAGDWTGNVRLFSRESSTPLWTHTGASVYEVDISEDGEYVAAASGGVLLFKQTGNEPVWEYQVGYLEHVAFSANGTYVTAVGDLYARKIFLFHRENPFPLWNHDTGNWLNSISISAGGEGIAAGDRDHGSVYFFPTRPILSGEASPYSFTTIAHSTEPFAIFSNRPAIGCDGKVVFHAFLENGKSGIFVGDDSLITPVAETGGQFTSFGPYPSVNCEGTVVFQGSTGSGLQGIFSAKGGLIQQIATAEGYFNSLSSNPLVNDMGTVVFGGGLGTGPPNVGGIFKASNGLMTGINLGGLSSDYDMNNRDVIVFRAGLPPVGDGIFASQDGITTTIADTGGTIGSFTSSPSVNTKGAVAFRAVLDTGEDGIYTIRDGVLHKIADTNDPFPNGFQGNPRINDADTVVFETYQGGALFRGPDPIYDKIIGSGDRLAGSTVQSVSLGGINNAGQIAFHAELKDGSQGIFRVDPVSETQIPPRGDITQDGKVDLHDTIVALQVVTANAEPPIPPVWLDVNGDHRIGLQEAIYPMKLTAGLLNHAPEMPPIENKTVDEDSKISFTVSATDADDDPLVFSAEGLPEGARFYSATGTFTWTPTFSQSGVYVLTLRVTDRFYASDSETVTITVTDREPLLTIAHFPLAEGNWWEYRDSFGGPTEYATISGTRTIHGALAYAFEFSTGETQFFSVDAEGVKLHGEYVNMAEYTGDVYFDTPLLLLPNHAPIGTEQISTTTYSMTLQGSTYHVDITSTCGVVAIEDVQTENTVLKDCFKICLRIVQVIREINQTIDSGIGYEWLYKDVGTVKSLDGSGEATVVMSLVENRIAFY